jgi:predicted phosphate transport protein (TIGR00153 family)
MSSNPIFSQLFGRSPIEPIQHHMSICENCASELRAYFEAVFNEDWAVAGLSASRITELEKEADAIKRDVRLNLPRSLFMPVSRDHLLEVVRMQDKVANRSKDVAGLILGRKMKIPAAAQDDMRSSVEASIKAVSYAREVMDELNDLVITGFSGREIEFVENIIDKLDEAEHESDVRLRELRHGLYKIEDSMNPVDAMFVYKVVELIGEIADDAQKIGNRMMSLIAH